MTRRRLRAVIAAEAAVGCGKREFGQLSIGLGSTLEDPERLVDGSEQARMPRYVLGAAEEQVAVVPEGIVEQGNDAALKLGVEVDQKVAAGDQIELGKRRVAQQIVHRKQAKLAQVARNAVAAVLAHEEALQALG